MPAENIIEYFKAKKNKKDEMQMPGRADSLLSDEQSQKLQISASCRNLADLDFLTVTDSFLVIRLQEFNRPLKEILRTKVYWNDLNPNYAETATIDFFFEIRQKLHYEVYHQDNPPQLVGSASTTVGQVFGSPDHGIVRPLICKGKEQGKIVIRCDKVQKNNNKQVQFQFRAQNLPDFTVLCCIGGTSPFFRVFRKREKDELLVYESETLELNRNPRFKPFKLSERRLCRNDENSPFQVRFYDYSNSGKHQLIGSCHIRLSQLANQKIFQINGKNGQNNGTLMMDRANRYTKYQFGDYIGAGLQLALVTCIDFTASNGIARVPNSLHFNGNGKQSQYAQALGEVSRILLDYDYDKLVPVYGFGAKVRMPNFDSHGKVHHCFPLNGNLQNPNVFQVQGLMQAYHKSIPFMQFGGPTRFSGLIDEAMKECRTFQHDNSQYLVLFILTDGQIHDRQEVIDQLIACGKLPISIIIVGVGNGDFGIMHQLDDDDCLMRDSKGRKTQRDLVQFVEFRQFKNNGIQLAKEVLEELPRQVAEYFQLMKMSPGSIKSVKTDIQFQQELRGTNRSNQGMQPAKGSKMWK